MPDEIFEYRIVQYKRVEPENGETVEAWMPQRGVSGHIDGVSGRTYWRDALPWPAPTRDLADQFVKSLKEFDTRQTEGTVVWKE